MKRYEIIKTDLKYNLDLIKEKLKNVSNEKVPEIIAVVKGNGMGLGLEEVSNFLLDNEIKYLAVATFEEAIELYNLLEKRENKNFDILLLSPIQNKEELKDLIERNIILTISSKDDYLILESILSTYESKINYKVHLKVDTGLGRYGFYYENKDEIFEVFKENEKKKILNICGMYTHFSKPIDKKWTKTQFDRFINIRNFLSEKGFIINMCHVSASTAFLKYPNMCLDAVRIGSIIQGRTLICKDEFRKVGKLKSNISEIKVLPKNAYVSYNKTFKTKKETAIAIVPVGYMDGFEIEKKRDDFSLLNNLASIYMEIKKVFKNNKKYVTISNKKYPVIGKIGMYHTEIDITGAKNIHVGDEVEIVSAPIFINKNIRRDYV